MKKSAPKPKKVAAAPAKVSKPRAVTKKVASAVMGFMSKPRRAVKKFNQSAYTRAHKSVFGI